MNISLLENARISLAKVRALEAMIADVDGLRGRGISAAVGRNTGAHSDPTHRAVLELEQLREKLFAAKEQAAQDYLVAETELKTVPDDEMRIILYWRHLQKLSWHDVADKLGPGYSSDTVKQRHSRYARSLKRTTPASANPVRGGAAVCC